MKCFFGRVEVNKIVLVMFFLIIILFGVFLKIKLFRIISF